MKKLNLIPILLAVALVIGCSKNSSNTVKPATTTATNSLVADSVRVYAGAYNPNPNIVNPLVTNGLMSSAVFAGPMGMTMDASGNLYIADYYSDDIRKITPAGMVSTISTGMDMPSYIAMDASGNMYVTYVQIDKVMPNGSLNELSNDPFIGLTADNNGNIYSATPTQIMKLDQSSGKMDVYAGTGASGSADGAISTASFASIQSLAADKSGNLFAMDGNSIRIINIAKGQVQTLALKGSPLFVSPQDIAVDQWDNIYVVNYGNDADGFILKVAADGTVSNFAGNAKRPANAAGLSGQPLSVSFEGPQGIFILPSGNILVSCYDNVIQEIVTHKQQ